MSLVTFIIWVCVGIGAGIAARFAVRGANEEARGPVATAVLGTLGAVVAGFAYDLLSTGHHGPVDLFGLACVAVGAAATVIVAGTFSVPPPIPEPRGRYSTRHRK